MEAAGLLPRAHVLSTVSGGSVIVAFYAYSDLSFEEFDRRVVKLLRAGLMMPMLVTALTTTEGVKAFLSACVQVAHLFLFLALILLGPLREIMIWRPRRFASRTTILQRTLERKLFGNTTLNEVRRPGLNVVINATELQTGSAFRFGSKESGSWRFGRVAAAEVGVGFAVAASAAFPLLLPSLEQDFMLTDRKGTVRLQRVVLTDGAVYDNLGVTAVWPGRDQGISTNVFPSDFIVCCNAGQGLRQDTPGGFLKRRLELTFAAILDRVQNESMSRHYREVQAGAIAGFILPYLGQRDDTLPAQPDDLVPRDAVRNYPVDFKAMSESTLALLTKRGEQLTSTLLSTYWPTSP